MDEFPYRALVVDDEPAVRQCIVRSLVQQGFRCQQAQDGRSGAALLAEQRYDVVVTDLRMPGEHGYSLVQQVLLDENRPLLVVLTGVAEPRLVRHLLLSGVDDVMFKPVDFSLFAVKIRALVESRPPPHEDPTDAANVSSDTEEILRPGDEQTATVDSRMDAIPAFRPVSLSSSRLSEELPPLLLKEENHEALRALLERSAKTPSTPKAAVPFTVLPVLVLCLIATILTTVVLLVVRRETPASTDEPLVENGMIVELMARPTAAQLSQLARISLAQDLTIRSTRLTDRDLDQLVRLPNIRGFDLSNSPVTDQGLKSLARMPNLKRLDLRGTQVSRDGIRDLTLPNLEYLRVPASAFDEAFESMERMPSLYLVDEDGNVISSPAVERQPKRHSAPPAFGGPAFAD